MSDPSILLLLTCVTCADSTNSFTNLSTPDCAAVEASRQPQRPVQPRGTIDCTHSISAPEAIPAFLTTASQPVVTVQTTAMEGAIAPRPAPPEPFILPETFTKSSTAANPTQPNQPSTPASISLVDPTDLLKLGSRGESVSRLQEELQRLEYYTGAIDGIYGRLTFTAVAKFQQTEGLTVDGIVGPTTWARLQALATPAISTPSNREATATLNPNNALELTTTTASETQTSDQTARPSEERLETASAAGEIAENAPVPEESQAPQIQDPGLDDLEQPAPNQESPPAPEFVFDTSPSGFPFYFWIGAWAIVYIGGMLFIFKGSISSKLGLNWGHDDESEQQDIQLPVFGQPNAMDQFASALDYDQPDSSDEFGSTISSPSRQEKQNLVSQNDPPLYFSRELNSPLEVEESQADAKPLNHSSKSPIFSLLEKLVHESPGLSNQELTPVWADGGVVEPIRGLFSDLPHPLGDYTSERRRNKAIATPPHPAALVQSIKQSSKQSEVPSTLIATLPAEDPETNNSYIYSLLDNAEGYFLLEGNELRIYDAALVQIESDIDHTITLRRTDTEGTQVDKSFVVSFTKAEDDDSAEMARSA